jgi:hypothetical protein
MSTGCCPLPENRVSRRRTRRNQSPIRRKQKARRFTQTVASGFGRQVLACPQIETKQRTGAGVWSAPVLAATRRHAAPRPSPTPPACARTVSVPSRRPPARGRHRRHFFRAANWPFACSRIVGTDLRARGTPSVSAARCAPHPPDTSREPPPLKRIVGSPLAGAWYASRSGRIVGRPLAGAIAGIPPRRDQSRHRRKSILEPARTLPGIDRLAAGDYRSSALAHHSSGA